VYAWNIHESYKALLSFIYIYMYMYMHKKYFILRQTETMRS